MYDEIGSVALCLFGVVQKRAVKMCLQLSVEEE